MPTNLAVRPTEATALSRLFASYVTGEISDVSWTSMMSLLDESGANAEERLALASFFSDACTDLGASAVKVPALVEVGDYVEMLRAA